MVNILYFNTCVLGLRFSRIKNPKSVLFKGNPKFNTSSNNKQQQTSVFAIVLLMCVYFLTEIKNDDQVGNSRSTLSMVGINFEIFLLIRTKPIC